MIYDSIAPSLVAESIRRLREEADAKRTKTYQRNENFHLGGEATREYLKRHEGEEDESWFERKDRFTDCGLTGRIAGALIAALYGKPVDRMIHNENGEVDEDASEELADILENNHWHGKQRIIGQGQVVAGDAWASVRWSDRLNDLKLHTVDPQNMMAELDPDDPMREITQIETVIDTNGDAKPRHWVWTLDRYGLFDEDGKPLLDGADSNGWRENPYGVLPYVHWRGLPMSGSFWGISPVRGVVDIHRLFNNRESNLDRLIVFQAHSQFILKDHNAENAIKSGPGNAWALSADGDAYYANPEADIQQVRESLGDLWQRAFDVGGVPMSVIRGGQANSGFQLVQEFRTMAEIVDDLKTEAKRAEEEFIRVICRIGRAHGLPLPDDPIVDVDFNSQVIPADKQAEFERDYLKLTGTPQTITRRDFLMKWEGKTEDTVDEYMAELEAEESARRPFGSFTLPEIPAGESVL